MALARYRWRPSSRSPGLVPLHGVPGWPRIYARASFSATEAAVHAGTSRRDDECLGRGGLHAGVEPGELARGLRIRAGGDLEQFLVAQPLRALGNHGPGRLHEGGEDVEVLQVAQ